MNKRVIAAVSAGVLALLGVLVLVIWAQGANDRAFDGAKLVSVVRLTEDTAANTSSVALADQTEVVKLPDEAVPYGAVTDLSQVKGLSTNAAVQKGELLLKSRMAAPGSKSKSNGLVPKGFQEVTIDLNAERSVGGVVKAGDKVGMVITAESKDGKVQGTKSILNQVLVTKVQTSLAAGEEGNVTGTMVTLALKTHDVERVVHGQKWATVWLTLQNEDTDLSGSKMTGATQMFGTELK